MRILWIASSFARFPGDPLAAAGNSWYELARELGRHTEITVVTPAQAEAPQLERIDGLEIRRVAPERPIAALHKAALGPGAVRVWRVTRSLGREAAALAPAHDLVHALWLFPGGWATRNLPGPKLLTFPDAYIDLYPKVPLVRCAARRLVGSFDACAALDPAGRRILETLGARSVEVVPTPVRLQGFAPAPPPTSDEVVYVGRLAKAKRLDVLLDAMALAHRDVPSLKLVVVGDGPDRPELEARTRELGLTGRVSFRGPQSQEGVREALTEARALVLSSDREGLPAVAVEALSVGRPVVTTAVGGLPDLLGGRAGVVVPPRDPAALADGILEALRRAWDADVLRARAGRSAVEAVAARYLEIYADLLGSAEGAEAA